MGANEFLTMARGKDAQEAFANASDAARYEHGHGGYTGTIAEKGGFVVIDAGGVLTPTPNEGVALARDLLDADDERISDKRGPAGCIKVHHPVKGEAWLFFGWASS